MSAHDDEAALRGHGPRPMVCDHETHKMPLGAQAAEWCRRCGALHIGGQWEIPSLLLQAVRDRDTMHATLTIAQERGTALVEENRLIKAKLVGYGG